MSPLKEFKYSMITFIISLIFNATIISLLYYFFNINQFPPRFGRDFWIITVLVLLAITFFVKKYLILHTDLSSARKSIIIFSSMFCTFMIMLFYLDTLSNYGIKTKEISNIEEVYSAKSIDLKIQNFDIINQPIIYSQIISRKKPRSKYAQVIFAYPFKSSKRDVFYCLKFKKEIETKSDEETQKQEIDDLLLQAKKTVQKYDFQKIKNFEYLTKMSPEFDEYSKTVTNENTIYLRPVTETVEKRADKELMFLLKSIVVVFLGYIVIFLLSRIPNWK